MNADDRSSQVNDAVIDELVAYLDGELDAEASREVEQRLSQDAQYRQRLRQLQQSWDLLDRLPKADVNDVFTQSTVAMIAVTAGDDVKEMKAKQTRRRKGVWWLGVGSLAVSFLVSYVLVSRIADRRNKRLLRDLPVIERMDEYRYADSIEFLRMLDAEGLFAEEEIENEI